MSSYKFELILKDIYCEPIKNMNFILFSFAIKFGFKDLFSQTGFPLLLKSAAQMFVLNLRYKNTLFRRS